MRTTDVPEPHRLGARLSSNAPGYYRGFIPGKMVFNTSGNELGCLASAADDRAGSESFCL
ncbi:hypothetical protein KCP76_13065 [Salmonella enterica subsp. enterica serovar Weltevreden]|nr:hypothetical protein KCP76_13065 [Salmonella enterica subsp. enterica serovar Weltevreden]